MINDHNDFRALLYDIFQLIISLKSTRNNVQYLINAVKEVIKSINLKDPKLLDLINRIIYFFSFSKALSKINIDLKSKVLIDEIFNLISEKEEDKKKSEFSVNETFISISEEEEQMHIKNKNKQKELDEKFKEFKKELKEKVFDKLKSELPKELLFAAKSINIDSISLYLGIPKYKSGISLIFKFNGLTEFVSQ